MYSYVLVFRSRQGCGPLPTVTGYARIEDDLAMLTTSSDAGKVESDSRQRPHPPLPTRTWSAWQGTAWWLRIRIFLPRMAQDRQRWHKLGKGYVWLRILQGWRRRYIIKCVVLRAYKFIFTLYPLPFSFYKHLTWLLWISFVIGFTDSDSIITSMIR